MLTDKQKRELRAQIGPFIDETVSDTVRRAVEDQVRRATADPSSTGFYGELALGGRGNSKPARSRERELTKAEQVFARLGMVVAASQGDRATALDLARTLDIESEYKAAQSAGNGAGGGFLIAEDMALDIIELLRPVSVVRQIQPVMVQIPRGSKTTPRIDVGVASGYVAEGAEIPTETMNFGQVILSAKKLATLVVLTNELLQFSNGNENFNAEQIILDEMLASIGQTEDVKFLFGSGASAEPLGIVPATDSGNIFDSSGSTVAEVVADLAKAITLLRNANVKFRRPAWIFSGRTEVFLQTLLDANGHFVFRDEIENGKLLRFPFYSTENIPNNGGAGSNESSIILVDAAEVMLGDVAAVQIDRSNSATIKIDGIDTSLFSTDRSAIRVRTWNDLAMRHDVGAAIIQAVTWGA